MIDKAKEVGELIEKAAKANNGADAMHYSQAALSAATAMCAVKAAEAEQK